ncbi:hypothetical protein KIL84_014753 [Mauremys mutica]|uniref:Uncharacterized protein n=1 Tax=Mauremys mutica TaxID=74926 RepID=A0A9D4B119_9SAUR|nr:hypothetical protein KIL84_014753 [Mauremys mutica]
MFPAQYSERCKCLPESQFVPTGSAIHPSLTCFGRIDLPYKAISKFLFSFLQKSVYMSSMGSCDFIKHYLSGQLPLPSVAQPSMLVYHMATSVRGKTLHLSPPTTFSSCRNSLLTSLPLLERCVNST